MPDLNDPDFSPSSPHALRSFPDYTCYTMDHEPLHSFCCQYQATMKGVEVQERHGEGFGKDIRHAINQLRYALPHLVVRYADSANTCHPNDCLPFFILPVVVTNAPLRLLKENLKLDQVLARLFHTPTGKGPKRWARFFLRSSGPSIFGNCNSSPAGGAFPA